MEVGCFELVSDLGGTRRNAIQRGPPERANRYARRAEIAVDL